MANWGWGEGIPSQAELCTAVIWWHPRRTYICASVAIWFIETTFDFIWFRCEYSLQTKETMAALISGHNYKLTQLKDRNLGFKPCIKMTPLQLYPFKASTLFNLEWPKDRRFKTKFKITDTCLIFQINFSQGFPSSIWSVISLQRVCHVLCSTHLCRRHCFCITLCISKILTIVKGHTSEGVTWCGPHTVHPIVMQLVKDEKQLLADTLLPAYLCTL